MKTRRIYCKISLAAATVHMHPQTLRVYEIRGLVKPDRSEGNTRYYSEEDLERLRRIQELTNLGLNIAGVKLVLELEAQLETLRRRGDN